MGAMEPFNQLTGTLKVYLAPATEPEPVVNAQPAGNWVHVGATDGEQSIAHMGELTRFRDNLRQGPVKVVRPEEDVEITMTIVELTLENWARVISSVSRVISASGPPPTKRLPLKRGADPTEYSLLLRGNVLSPYGAFPGQFYIPRCVAGGEPTATFAKDGRPGLEVTFIVLEDIDQPAGDEMGWLRVQTA